MSWLATCMLPLTHAFWIPLCIFGAECADIASKEAFRQASLDYLGARRMSKSLKRLMCAGQMAVADSIRPNTHKHAHTHSTRTCAHTPFLQLRKCKLAGRCDGGLRLLQQVPSLGATFT